MQEVRVLDPFKTIEPGISPGCPSRAEIAPLRESHTSLPKCRSRSVKLWWQLMRSTSTTGSPKYSAV